MEGNDSANASFKPRRLILYCIVSIHFYSTSHSMSFSEALPTTAIDTVSDFTCRKTTGKSTTTQKHSQRSTNTVLQFHAEAPQVAASEGLAQGPCVTAREGFEPTTLRLKGIDSTNAPPRPTCI